MQNTVLRKHFKSPNPAVNVSCPNQPLATNTIKSLVLAYDGGATYAQFFEDSSLVSRCTHWWNHQSWCTYQTDQWQCSSWNQQGSLPMFFACMYGVSAWESEAYQQHQNPAKHRYQTVKPLCNIIFDQTGAPANCWLLCLMYVCFVLNNTYSMSIKATPLRKATSSNTWLTSSCKFWQAKQCQSRELSMRAALQESTHGWTLQSEA
jgi:hypothetical protein